MAKKNTKKTTSKSKPMMAEMMKPMNTEKKGDSCSSCASCMCHCGPWAMTFLRVVLAGIFLQAGIMKLMAGPAIFGMTWFGYLLGAVEVLAGVLLLVGYKTFWSAKVVAVIMTGAIFLVHLGAGWNSAFYYPLTLLAAALVVAHYGPGKAALDNKCGSCGSGCSCC